MVMVSMAVTHSPIPQDAARTPCGSSQGRAQPQVQSVTLHTGSTCVCFSSWSEKLNTFDGTVLLYFFSLFYSLNVYIVPSCMALSPDSLCLPIDAPDRHLGSNSEWNSEHPSQLPDPHRHPPQLETPWNLVVSLAQALLCWVEFHLGNTGFCCSRAAQMWPLQIMALCCVDNSQNELHMKVTCMELKVKCVKLKVTNIKLKVICLLSWKL